MHALSLSRSFSPGVPLLKPEPEANTAAEDNSVSSVMCQENCEKAPEPPSPKYALAEHCLLAFVATMIV